MFVTQAQCSEVLQSPEHPGQFLRFHSSKHLKEYGSRLRVGKTKAIENRFKEPKKYVGLRG